MTPRALALSPHLDDAAFSCGGTLARLAAQGWDVTLCTAFTHSVPSPTGFALACQLDKGLSPDVDYMALRRAEDLVACSRLDVSPLWLDLPEAPHRGYPDAKALFASPRDEDAILAPLSDRLRKLLETPPALLLAPQALGGHVDHVLLARALRSVLRTGQPVWWWADFPYAMRPGTPPGPAVRPRNGTPAADRGVRRRCGAPVSLHRLHDPARLPVLWSRRSGGRLAGSRSHGAFSCAGRRGVHPFTAPSVRPRT